MEFNIDLAINSPTSSPARRLVFLKVNRHTQSTNHNPYFLESSRLTMTGCIVCSNQHKSGSAQADSDEAAAASQRFTFVLDKNQPGTRNHAMRQYWRERHEAQRGKRPDRRQRRSPPNSGSRSPPKHQRQDISPSSSSEDARYIGQDANQPGIPTQFLTGANHALASSRLDPFDVFPVRLTSEHHKLMHHCISFTEVDWSIGLRSNM